MMVGMVMIRMVRMMMRMVMRRMRMVMRRMMRMMMRMMRSPGRREWSTLGETFLSSLMLAVGNWSLTIAQMQDLFFVDDNALLISVNRIQQRNGRKTLTTVQVWVRNLHSICHTYENTFKPT